MTTVAPTEMTVLARWRPVVPDYVLAMALLLSAEAMFFGGLVSAYLVAHANAVAWPPAGQPRLPVERTAVNTLVLALSAVTMQSALRALRISGRAVAVRRWLALTAGLGALFVGLQGYEWARLIGFGLTTSSSVYGAFFYLIVGAHALHVLAGLVFLGAVLWKLRAPRCVRASSIYWFFVVALWPVLYVLVYLS